MSVLVGVLVTLGLLWQPAGAALVKFRTVSISTTADDAFSVFAADVDGDGDVDILSASYLDDKIAWYENDGRVHHATFTEHVITEDPDGRYGRMRGFADGARSVFAADLDGDGDVDVLSASENNDKIAWYENDGGSPPSFTARTVSTHALGAWSVFATDVDGDGDVDVLSASYLDDKIAWYENRGGVPVTFVEHVLTADPDGIVGPLDGLADIAVSVRAADVDGDGDKDILFAAIFANLVAWYENDGASPPSFTLHTVAAGLLEIQYPWSVFATDLDADGDVDLLSASEGDSRIAWYENNGGAPPSFTTHTITSSALGAVSVFAADVDGDGDTDILSTSVADHKVACYDNLGGSPPTFITRTITTDADSVVSVFAVDVDGDGDTDVLSASEDDRITWYKNRVVLPEK